MVMESDEVTRTKVEITPEVAEEMLGHNTHNRNIRESHVYRLALAMERGDWRYNGASLKVADDGIILDGQHRLLAVILSGVAIETDVVRGLPRDAQETMDANIIRKLSDLLRLRGEPSSVQLAASLTWLFKLNNKTMKSVDSRYNPTRQQAIELLDENPAMREAVRKSGRVARAASVPLSLVAALYHKFSEKDQEDANDFFHLAVTGDGISPGHPVYTLRRWATNERMRSDRTASNKRGAMMVKAWNAWREGRELHSLSWRPGGKNNEPFPEIR